MAAFETPILDRIALDIEAFLRQLNAPRGATAAQIAEAIGENKGTVYNIMADQKRPHSARFRRTGYVKRYNKRGRPATHWQLREDPV